MLARRLIPICLLLPMLVLLAGCDRATDALRPATERTPASIDALDSPEPTPPAPENSHGDNLPPVARIVSPVPSSLFVHFFDEGQPMAVSWSATDPDGPGPGVKSFRYRLIREDDPDFFTFIVQPDSLARRDGPEFTDWTQVSGNTDHIDLAPLAPNFRYVLYLTVFDRRRAYDASFNLQRNALFFAVRAAPGLGETSSEELRPVGRGEAGPRSGPRR